jgi:hypothetical protein
VYVYGLGAGADPGAGAGAGGDPGADLGVGVDPGAGAGADPGAGAGADPGVTFISGGGSKLGFATGSELGLGEPTTLFSIVVNLDIISFNEADVGAGTGVGEPILSYLLCYDIFLLLMVWFYFFGSKTLGHFL